MGPSQPGNRPSAIGKGVQVVHLYTLPIYGAPGIEGWYIPQSILDKRLKPRCTNSSLEVVIHSDTYALLGMYSTRASVKCLMIYHFSLLKRWVR